MMRAVDYPRQPSRRVAPQSLRQPEGFTSLLLAVVALVAWVAGWLSPPEYAVRLAWIGAASWAGSGFMFFVARKAPRG